MKSFALLIIALLFCGIVHARSGVDTVHIFFKLNEDKLYTPTKNKLDSLIYNDLVNNTTSVLIIGYADFLGSEEHNLGLSERRAKAIERYLIDMQTPADNIKLVIGKGEVARNMNTADGYAPDRRVDIVIGKMTAATIKKSKIKVGELPPEKITAYSKINTMKVGQTLRLEKIYFLLGRHIVTEESTPQLNNLYETLEDNPNLKIQIEGHICCLKQGYDALDDDTHEQGLSLNRAKYIYDYLVTKGIEKERLKFKGFGRTVPLVSPEKNTADEDMNRRVEIRVLEK